MKFRGASLLAFACALSACGEGRTTASVDRETTANAEENLPDDWLEQLRETPLESEIAINAEYAISAVFRKGDPVCVADSGGHIHGFYQLHDGNCGDPQETRSRFMSVWADYDSALEGWEGLAAAQCGDDTEPFDLGMDATGTGRFDACIPKLCGDQYVITAIYLSGSSTRAQGEGVRRDGPDLIYRIALGTTPATQEADLAEFRSFLAQLRLDGGSFTKREG